MLAYPKCDHYGCYYKGNEQEIPNYEESFAYIVNTKEFREYAFAKSNMIYGFPYILHLCDVCDSNIGSHHLYNKQCDICKEYMYDPWIQLTVTNDDNDDDNDRGNPQVKDYCRFCITKDRIDDYVIPKVKKMISCSKMTHKDVIKMYSVNTTFSQEKLQSLCAYPYLLALVEELKERRGSRKRKLIQEEEKVDTVISTIIVEKINGLSHQEAISLYKKRKIDIKEKIEELRDKEDGYADYVTSSSSDNDTKNEGDIHTKDGWTGIYNEFEDIKSKSVFEMIQWLAM